MKLSNSFFINFKFTQSILVSMIFFNTLALLLFLAISPKVHAKSDPQQALKDDSSFFKNLPTNTFTQILHIDFTRIIRVQPNVSWLDTKQNITSLAPRILEASCHIDVQYIKQLQAYYAHYIRQHKTVKQHWQHHKQAWLTKRNKTNQKISLYHYMQNHFDLDDYKNSLQRERVNQALLYAIENRATCPAWVIPNPNPYTIHRDAYRWQLILETMGSLQYVYRNQNEQIGGSGQGRLLGGYGFGLNWGMAFGVELGFASLFPKDHEGQRSVQATWTSGIPVIFRYWHKFVRLDTEVAAVMRQSDKDWSISAFGYRVSQAIGFSALRLFGFLPHFMIWGGYESYYGKEQQHVIRVGSRVGVSWGGND